MKREMMLVNFTFINGEDPEKKLQQSSVLMMVDTLQPELDANALFMAMMDKDYKAPDYDPAEIKRKACHEFIEVTKQVVPSLQLKSFSLNQIMNPDNHTIPPYKPKQDESKGT